MCTYYLIVNDVGDSILLHSLISGDQDSPQKEVSGDPVEAEADNQKGIRGIYDTVKKECVEDNTFCNELIKIFLMIFTLAFTATRGGGRIDWGTGLKEIAPPPNFFKIILE